MLDEIATDVGRNRDKHWMERNGWRLRQQRTALQNDPHLRALQQWHVEKKKFFFLLLCIFFILHFFFFQNCYKGYSLHDYKLKNTQECTAQMLTSKLMYKESKCMWGCITWCRSYITIKPCVCVCACSQDLKLAIKQALELFVPSSLRNSETQNFITCSLFSVSLKVKPTQEHKKLVSKKNPRNSKLGKICCFQH